MSTTETKTEHDDAETQSIKSSATATTTTTTTTTKKEEKKKYPQLRKQLFEHYGLSIRDHFIRDVVARHNINDEALTDHDWDHFFGDALTETLTRIAEPFLPQKLFPKSEPGSSSSIKNTGKLDGKSLLQVFSVRDISKPLHKLDQMDTGSSKSRMLHLVLTDGKMKVNAVEYQHVLLLDNLPIYPGMKIQLENVEILNGVLLLRPSSVIWIGGEVESFTKKYLAQIKARDAESRVHQKNLLKGETPPPKFEDVDQTRERKQDDREQHDKRYDNYNYQAEHLYDDEYQRKKAHKGYDSQAAADYYEQEEYYDDEQYDDDGAYDDGGYDDGEYYDEDEYYEEEEPHGQQQQQQQGQTKGGQNAQYQPKYQQKQQQGHQQQQPPQPQHQQQRYQAKQQQPRQQHQHQQQQQQQQQWNNNSNQYYQDPQAMYGQQQQQQQHYQQGYGQGQGQGQAVGNNGRGNNVQAPTTLMELYAIKNLPYTAYISAEIKAAYLKVNRQTNEAYIEFDVSDETGKCKGMTSTYLMQWISSQYATHNGNQMNQQLANLFFSQWGNRYINIKMELKDPQRMVVFHEIKWQ